MKECSGTITTGGEAQTLLVEGTGATNNRRGFFVQNTSSGDLFIRFGADASAAGSSIKLLAGAYYETPASYQGDARVSIFGATTGQSFAAGEW